MKYVLSGAVAALGIGLAGCATPSGTYEVSAITRDGQLAPRGAIAGGGRALYAARNAMCVAYPGATVRMIDTTTRKELQGESPYPCSSGK